MSDLTLSEIAGVAVAGTDVDGAPGPSRGIYSQLEFVPEVRSSD